MQVRIAWRKIRFRFAEELLPTAYDYAFARLHLRQSVFENAYSIAVPLWKGKRKMMKKMLISEQKI